MGADKTLPMSAAGNIARWLAILLLLFVTLTACDTEPETVFKIQSPGKPGEKILLGIVDAKGQYSFLKGAMLCVEQINQDGGVLGHKIQTFVHDDGNDPERGVAIAHKLVSHKDLAAVVGHVSSSVAIPVSIIYDEAGVVFLSPGAKRNILTRDDSKRTFRNVLADEQTGEQLAGFAARKKYDNMVIVYVRTETAERLSDAFHEHAVELGIEISGKKSFFPWRSDFSGLIAEIKTDIEKEVAPAEAIFLVADAAIGAEFIKQARTMGVEIPFLGSDGLDDPDLIQIAGVSAEGVTVPTAFNPHLKRNSTREFVRLFKARFGVMPTTWDAHGYDAVRVLAEVIRQSGSATPGAIASRLRYLQNWKSVCGEHSFLPNGDIAGRKLFFKTVSNGHFVYLPGEGETVAAITEPIEGVTLRIPLESAVATLDPGFPQGPNSESSTDSVEEITQQLFLALTRFDYREMKLLPELATAWEISDDARVHTFHLRKDAFWTDGEPVTAHDVVWAARRNVRPETRSRFAQALYILKNGRQIHQGDAPVNSLGATAIDSNTVEFTLSRPAVYFPLMTTMSVYRPLPGHVIEKFGSSWTEPENIVSNGPYKLLKLERGNEIILGKSETYFGSDSVQISDVRYYVIPDGNVGLAMYKQDELDILGGNYLKIPAGELKAIEANPELEEEYYSRETFCTHALIFNPVLKPMDDINLRKAIVSALERELLMSLVTRGKEREADAFSPPALLDADQFELNMGIDFNPGRARQLLNEAKERMGKYAKGSPLILVHDGSLNDIEIAQAIKTSIKYFLGLDIVIQRRGDLKPGRPPEAAPSYHIYQTRWCGGYPEPSAWLREVGKVLENSGWQNKRYSQLLEQAGRERAEGERISRYKLAERLLIEQECVVAPLFYDTAHYLVKSRLSGWHAVPVGGQRIRDWFFNE